MLMMHAAMVIASCCNVGNRHMTQVSGCQPHVNNAATGGGSTSQLSIIMSYHLSS